MLQVQSLHFDYDDKALLRDVSFDLAAGQLLHLRGENGSGKTTLLKLLATLYTPVRGTIIWDGSSIEEDRAAYRRHLCLVGHRPGLSPQLTVREACYHDQHWLRCRPSVDELLQRFGLLHVADKRCHCLSAGQQRRVALLRLAMTDARLWLLDEPLVALDQPAIAGLADLMSAHLQQGGLIILTSHQSLPDALAPYAEYQLT